METVIKSETALRIAGMKLLMEGLGAVNAERFVHCLKNEHFDYTEWQRDLWKDKTIEKIHQSAAALYTATHKEV